MTIQRPSWFTLGLMAAVVVLGIVIWQNGCKPVKVFDTSKADSVTRVKDSLIKIKDHDIEAQEELTAYWRNKYDSAWNSIQNGIVIIKEKTDSLKKLHAAYLHAVSERDTLAQLTTCEDLLTEMDGLLDALQQEKVALDSAHMISDSTIAGLGKTINLQAAEIDLLKSEVAELKTEISDLVKNNSQLAKKAKLGNVLAKAGALIAAILTASLIFKK